LLALKANLIFLSYGVNDAKYFGDTPKTLVSQEEYAANMLAVVRALQQQTEARLVLLTPTPVVEALSNAAPPGFHHRMRWDNADLQRFGGSLQQIGVMTGVRVIDVFAAFGASPNPALFLADGVHPNVDGERLILEQIASQWNL
jgi:lysophospholipase L1-like esterase